jgi:hypothetical protein
VETLLARSPSTVVVVVVPRLAFPRVDLDDDDVTREMVVTIDIVDDDASDMANAHARAKLCGRATSRGEGDVFVGRAVVRVHRSRTALCMDGHDDTGSRGTTDASES